MMHSPTNIKLLLLLDKGSPFLFIIFVMFKKFVTASFEILVFHDSGDEDCGLLELAFSMPWIWWPSIFLHSTYP